MPKLRSRPILAVVADLEYLSVEGRALKEHQRTFDAERYNAKHIDKELARWTDRPGL